MKKKRQILKRGIVVAYGKRWDRHICEKNNFEDVPKRVKGRSSGLYVLYKNNRVIYVGKSETGLRSRISRHVSDNLKKKWDSFTWFITRKRYTHELEAFLHKTLWGVKDVLKGNTQEAKFIETKRRVPSPR